MKRGAMGILVLLVGATSLAGGACDSGFGAPRFGRRLVVDIQGYADTNLRGAPLSPLELAIDHPARFRVIVRAENEDAQPATDFSGYVRISARPGAVERVTGPSADGRNVLLTSGVSPEVEVELANAFGTTYIVADDLGYVPADPLRTPPPACADGKDNDGDGRIDFPADEGCAFANDDSEDGGSYTQGASSPIYYKLPRVADVRGLVCREGTCSGGGKTPFPKEPIAIDTGFHTHADGSQGFDFDLVVTRIASDGFYVTDVKDGRGGFQSIFAFNFNAPPRMRVCDRLKTFAGTATEFFGMTQMSYPTWTLEEWNPQVRPCLVPEPIVLGPLDVPGVRVPGGRVEVPAALTPLTGSLVRAVTDASASLRVMVTPKLGAKKVPVTNGVYVPEIDATNCDYNDDGRIDFTAGNAEQLCADTCTKDAECSEYSNFAARSTFRLTISDGNNVGAVQADATASTEFKPMEQRGVPIRSFTGTLHFFSGGAQYTIEARCKDDIVVDLNATPLVSGKACVVQRTNFEDNPQ